MFVLCSINGTFNVMWKEILIIFIVVFLIRAFLDVYMIINYNKVMRKFYLGYFEDIEVNIKRFISLCDVFSLAPWNKKTCFMYNNLCIVLASVALLNNNDTKFLFELNKIKREHSYELKSFMLTLYYYSKNDIIKAKQFYENHSKIKKNDENLSIVLNNLFSYELFNDNGLYESLIKSLNNQAIIKMLVTIKTNQSGDGSLSSENSNN